LRTEEVIKTDVQQREKGFVIEDYLEKLYENLQLINSLTTRSEVCPKIVWKGIRKFECGLCVNWGSRLCYGKTFRYLSY